MIEIIDRRPAQSAFGRRDARVAYQAAWRRTAEVLWIVLNAPAIIEGRWGSLEGGGLSEDDRRLRALSRSG